jgi:hypothetical protein
VVGLNVRLEDGNDRDLLSFGERDVFVDQIHVRVDDREPRLALASE